MFFSMYDFQIFPQMWLRWLL